MYNRPCRLLMVNDRAVSHCDIINLELRVNGRLESLGSCLNSPNILKRRQRDWYIILWLAYGSTSHPRSFIVWSQYIWNKHYMIDCRNLSRFHYSVAIDAEFFRFQFFVNELFCLNVGDKCDQNAHSVTKTEPRFDCFMLQDKHEAGSKLFMCAHYWFGSIGLFRWLFETPADRTWKKRHAWD